MTLYFEKVDICKFCSAHLVKRQPVETEDLLHCRNVLHGAAAKAAQVQSPVEKELQEILRS
jgi:hypothetical protein